MPDITEAQARAMWAADMEINGHKVAWEEIEEGTRELFRMYVKAAEMAREQAEEDKPS
jgi:hypothetical protein